MRRVLEYDGFNDLYDDILSSVRVTDRCSIRRDWVRLLYVNLNLRKEREKEAKSRQARNN